MKPAHKILLAIILLAAATLRIYRIGFHSVWIDEIASMELSSARPISRFDCPLDQIITPPPNMTSLKQAGPITGIWKVLQGDTHPPLYLVTLRIWRTIFGESDAAGRSLSAIFSMIALLLLFDSMRLMYGVVPALWATAIMALATPQIDYAQEMRGYMMLVMWSLAAVNLTIRIEKFGGSRRRFILLILFLLAGMTTHYYGIVPAAAVGLYALLVLRGKARQTIVAACFAAGILFLVTTGPLLWMQRPNFHTNMTWIADDPQGLLGRTLRRVASLPLIYLIVPMERSMKFAPISIAIVILPIFLYQRRELLLWWLLAVFAMLLPAAADLANHSHTTDQVRYSLVASPAIYALAAAMLHHRRDWLRHLIPAAVVLTCFIGLSDAYYRPRKSDWRGFAQELDQKAGPNDVLVMCMDHIGDWYDPMLHAGAMHYMVHDQRPLLVLTKPPDESLRRELAAAPGVWLLYATLIAPTDRFLPGATQDSRIIFRPFIGQAVRLKVPATQP